MNNESKFGDKSLGRSPIERLLKMLEAYGVLYFVMSLFILIILIGIDSIIREELTNGVTFLILVFLILLSGNGLTENFFGSSVLAVFIILHISLFGFNSIPLIISFIIFLKFHNKLQQNLLATISIYLILDILSYHFALNTYLIAFFDKIGNIIFSPNVFIVISILPIAFLLLNIEKVFNSKFNNKLIKNYGTFLLLLLLIIIFFTIGYFFNILIFYKTIGVFIFLYIIASINFKNEIKKYLLIILPIVLIVTAMRYFLWE